MARDPIDELGRLGTFDADEITLRDRLLHFPLKSILPVLEVHLFDVEILNVEAEVGNSPSDAVVVSNDDGRYAWQRCSGDVQAWCLQMIQVPGGGIGKFQVRIVGE